MDKVESSVVQIIADHNIPNWETPWVKTKKYRSYGSGFCIKIGTKKYILTNLFSKEFAKKKYFSNIIVQFKFR